MPKKRAHGEGTILKRKDGSFEGRISLGQDAEGKRRRKSVYGRTRQEVRAKLDEVKRQLGNGTFSDSKITVADYLERWLKERGNHLKHRTILDYRYDIEHYIVPYIGKVRLDKLTPLKLQDMLSTVAAKVSPDRANKARRILHTALKQALRWQLIPRNPVEATDPMKHTRKEQQIWTAQETAQFLGASEGHRLYALFYLALSAGLRCGELLGLRWSDLDGSVLHVQRSLAQVKGQIIISTPKTEAGIRYVTLSPNVLEVLKAHRTKQQAERALLGKAWLELDLVFTKYDGGYLTPRNLAETWYRLQDNADVRRVRLHDLRHLNVSIRRKLGQDAKLIADQIGHTDPAFTTRLYTHLFDEDRQGAAVELSSWLPKSGPEEAN